METIYLNNCSNYSTTQELRELCAKYDTSIGDNVDIGSSTRLGRNVSIGNNVKLGLDVSIGNCVSIKDNVSIGISTRLEPSVVVGDNASIGYGVIIGYNSNIGHNVSISNRVIIPVLTTIPANHNIERILTLYNAYKCTTYKYNASVWEHDGELFIAMGYRTRTESEWNKNFWNDNNKFPKGSENGDRRLEVYNTIVKIGHQIFKEKV